MTERKSLLLRIDPALHDALQRWATAEFRSVNGHIEYLLRRALAESGRLSIGEPAKRPGDAN